MANLKEVRVRIASVKSTRQITSAMKMVSASKLRRAQNAILTMRPYAAKLHEIMQNLSGSLDDSDEGVFGQDRGDNNILLVPITSNRGLCGGFNANVIKQTQLLIRNTYARQQSEGNLKLFCIGKKSADAFRADKFNVVAKESEIFNQLSFEHVVEIAERLMADFTAKKYDKIILIYNQFKNAAVQVLQTEQFLPFAPKLEDSEPANQTYYLFEPSKLEILEALVPKSIKVTLYKALLDSYAAEHGARMTAMHKATENADDLVKQLNLSYNKARQAAITKEILEIVGGAEALNG